MLMISCNHDNPAVVSLRLFDGFYVGPGCSGVWDSIPQLS